MTPSLLSTLFRRRGHSPRYRSRSLSRHCQSLLLSVTFTVICCGVGRCQGLSLSLSVASVVNLYRHQLLSLGFQSPSPSFTAASVAVIACHCHCLWLSAAWLSIAVTIIRRCVGCCCCLSLSFSVTVSCLVVNRFLHHSLWRQSLLLPFTVIVCRCQSLFSSIAVAVIHRGVGCCRCLSLLLC